MNLTVYGEVAIDLLINSEGEISNRYGGAGFYASVAAAKQGATVDFLTIYNSELTKYQIFLCNSIGISLEYAQNNENYNLPKYLVTGYKNYEKKISRPINVIKNNFNYEPTIPRCSNGILVFPIGHTIPLSTCENAKNKNIFVFLDPKTNQGSINDCKQALKLTDVLLVNEDEAMLLTDAHNISEAINILSTKDIKYVIIKRGSKGCTLLENAIVTDFPSFKSNAICTLGSGDVFDGALASIFLETKDIKYSIEIAECLSASFIENFEIEFMLNKSALKNDMQERKKNVIHIEKEVVVYLAGPFFCEQEIKWVNYVKKMLELCNVKVLSPLHVNGIVNHDSSDNERKRIFDLDIKLMENANLVVALIDHDDSGTFFEIGYAYRNRIPIIGYKTSIGHLNNMIYCGCDKIVDSIDSLIEEVKNYGK